MARDEYSSDVVVFRGIRSNLEASDKDDETCIIRRNLQRDLVSTR